MGLDFTWTDSKQPPVDFLHLLVTPKLLCAISNWVRELTYDGHPSLYGLSNYHIEVNCLMELWVNRAFVRFLDSDEMQEIVEKLAQWTGSPKAEYIERLEIEAHADCLLRTKITLLAGNDLLKDLLEMVDTSEKVKTTSD